MVSYTPFVTFALAFAGAARALPNGIVERQAEDTRLGQWGPPIKFPTVTVAAVVLPNSGKVLSWSAYSPTYYVGSNNMSTITATYDPITGKVSEALITETKHDMFCPGLSLDARGRAVVTGGNNAPRTSIFDPSTESWVSGSNMTVGRGYQSQATLSDGRIFTVGGSWSGGDGGKNGEIYDPSADKWSKLPGCPVDPIITADKEAVHRADNHAWLFGWKKGFAFHAGPSKGMNWYGTKDKGSVKAAGARASDKDSMNGNAVMYDAVNGKILTLGGAPSYTKSQATNKVHVITIGEPEKPAKVEAVAPMKFARAFHNSIVLPDGTVFVTGGQSYAKLFTDTTAILTPELWDPATKAFKSLNPIKVSRTYHSVAILMQDGSIFTGGGGLCGKCKTNHFDAQIFYPPYLFNTDGSRATLPVITSVSPADSIKIGGKVTVKTNRAVKSFALLRYGSVTHAIDTDQRRIALDATAGSDGSTHTLTIPNDAGVALPGAWMLFALDDKGVPSVSKTLYVTI